MKTNQNLILLSATIFIFIFSLNGCDSKPVNLTTARELVKEYYESGKFDKELAEEINDAIKKFDNVNFGKNSVVIFDVDETALNNYGLAEQMGFGYVYEMNKKWNSELKAPAIKHVMRLYRFLINKKSKIIFLTGRNFTEYEVTYKNLKQAGYTEFDTLITQREHEYKLSAIEFKTKKRVELTGKGYDIIGTVGDQRSDLDGEYHGIQVKIPNYLYEIK